MPDTVFFNETTTNLGNGGVYTGAARYVGVPQSQPCDYTYFNVSAFADQAGTLRVEQSLDNSTWRRATADIALTANSVQTARVTITAPYYRVIYTNGATPTTAIMINSSFTEN